MNQTLTEEAAYRSTTRPVFGWLKLDPTRLPSTESRLGADATARQSAPRHPSQLVLDVARLLSAYWLPRATVGAATVLFETEPAGLSVVTNLTGEGSWAFFTMTPSIVVTNLTGRGIWDSSFKGSTPVTPLVDHDIWGLNRKHLYFDLADAYSAIAANIIGPVRSRQAALPADIAIAPSGTQADPLPNRTVAAIQDLKTWLNLTTEEVARLLGTSKGAVYYWRRADAAPRAQVGRNITRIHSLLRALRRVTTPEGFTAVLRAKPQGYERSAFDLLLNRDFEQAEALLNDFVFTRGRPAEPYWAGRVSEWPGAPNTKSTRELPPLKPPRANRLRVRLRTSD
jgi:hypothetical protein